MHTKRTIWTVVLFAILTLSLSMGSRTVGAEKLKFMADWIIGPKHAPFFVAREKGFWKKEGLNLSISRGFGSGNVAKVLNKGETDFSFVDAGVMILGRAKGMKLKQVGMIHAIYPITYGGLRSNGIQSPKDLAGKTFGGASFATSTFMLKLFLKNVGVDPKQVKIINMKPASVIPSFLSKKIDIMGIFTINSLPIIRYNLKKQGLDPDKELVLFPGQDYGLDGYANGLTVRDDQIQDKPELVRRFVRSTMAAFRYSVTYPRKSLDIFLRQHPEVGKATAAAQFDKMVEHLISQESRTTALGWMTAEKMVRTRDMMFEAHNLKKAKMPINDLYTNEFLEKRPITTSEIPAKYR